MLNESSTGGASVRPAWRDRGIPVPDWQAIDFFFDESLVDNPYPYFDALRETCPVLPL